MRQTFEDLTWAYYQRLKAGGWSDPKEGDSTHRQSLFWRDGNHPEMYGVASIQAAWRGFCMAWQHLGGPT